MTNFRIVARPTRDLLGEGPYWSARAGALFWVDIVGARLWELALANDRLRSWAMPEKICWVVEQAGSDDLLAGFKSSVADLALEAVDVPDVHRVRIRAGQLLPQRSDHLPPLVELQAGVLGHLATSIGAASDKMARTAVTVSIM